MKFAAHTGSTNNNRKGREPSAETQQLSAAIDAALESGKPIALSGIPTGDVQKMIGRLRNLAMKRSLSLSLSWADNGDPVFTVTRKAIPGSPAAVPTLPKAATKKVVPAADKEEATPAKTAPKPRKVAVKRVSS